MFQDLKMADVKSGFLIFLIALPLCLGIAAASSFPPVAGIFTAIIGGFVASFLGSSRLTIKGPAAGLIVIVLAAVMELGQGDTFLGYKRCLAAGVAAALIQILMAKFKAGKIANIMPPAVIHGMLAAIGVIIVAKQVHILLGVAPHAMSPIALLLEIPSSLARANPEIVAIGSVTLFTLFLFPLLPKKLSSALPPALIALVIVVPLALYWHLDENNSYFFLGERFDVGPKFLVQIPGNLLNSIVFPDFSVLTTFVGIKYAIMLALVGSIESLLTVAAVDGLDPERQKSDLNKDLFAVGVANLVSSMIGGLPMISEVVRSKANIDNGAQSKWANVFHALFLLIAVVFFASIIHEIPLSALAAMLILTGFRLSSPREFKKTYLIGLDQMVIFSTTLVVTLATDLLVGVAMGLVVKLVLHWFRGVPFLHLFKLPIVVDESEESIIVRLRGHAIFSNYLFLFSLIDKAIATTKKVTVDLSEANLIDHTTMARLVDLERLGQINVAGREHLRGVSGHELATHIAH